MKVLYTAARKKQNHLYFRRNFDKVQQIFIISGTIHFDIQSDWKIILKSTITTGTTQSNDDVCWRPQNARDAVDFLERETPELISPLL